MKSSQTTPPVARKTFAYPKSFIKINVDDILKLNPDGDYIRIGGCKLFLNDQQVQELKLHAALVELAKYKKLYLNEKKESHRLSDENEKLTKLVCNKEGDLVTAEKELERMVKLHASALEKLSKTETKSVELDTNINSSDLPKKEVVTSITSKVCPIGPDGSGVFYSSIEGWEEYALSIRNTKKFDEILDYCDKVGKEYDWVKGLRRCYDTKNLNLLCHIIKKAPYSDGFREAVRELCIHDHLVLKEVRQMTCCGEIALTYLPPIRV